MQRAPIIVVLGHVDHGKTTLLDALKKTRVAASEAGPPRLGEAGPPSLTSVEAGGITQSIGAYQLDYKGKKLTVIDTPGHAAFRAMRASGARVADIALLVVAANDGVQPQTVEALETIRQAHIPYIVAINKIDLPDADSAKVKTQLAEHESAVEGFGGTVPVVEISAKEGTHIPELLDMIFLVHDLSEIVGTAYDSLEAPVIESRKDSRKGPLISVVVRVGTLSLGDDIVAHGVRGTVRALFNDRGERMEEVLAGDPAQILGFRDVIPIGSVVRRMTQSSDTSRKNPALPPSPSVKSPSSDGKRDAFIVRADSVGALDALAHSMPEHSDIVSRGVGDVSESDVLLAESTGALIVGFRVKAPTSVTTLAETHGVVILTNPIIYKLLEDLVKPETKQVPAKELGRAKIIKIFDISGKKIAGCSIISGRLSVGDAVHIDGSGYTIKQLKKGKEDTTIAKAGEECGAFLTPENGRELNFSVGNDMIAFEKKT